MVANSNGGTGHQGQLVDKVRTVNRHSFYSVEEYFCLEVLESGVG